MSKGSKSFIKGAAVLAVSGIVCRVLGAATRIPLSNLIGQAGMGAYQMVYPVYSLLLVVSSSGLPIAISRLVSEKMAGGDLAGARNVLNVALPALSILGAALGAGLFLLGDAVAGWLGLLESGPAFRVVAPSLLLVSAVSAYRGYFQGTQRMSPTAVSQLIEQLCKMAVGLYFAAKWAPMGPAMGAAGAMMGVTVSEGAALLVMVICHRRETARRRLIKRRMPPGAGRQLLEQIFRIALPVTAGSCVVPLVSAVDSAMVMRVLTSSGHSAQAASSLFGLLTGFVQPIVHLPAVLSGSVAISLVPAIAAARVGKNRTLLEYETSLALRTGILLGLPCMVGLYILAEPLLAVLYGSLSPSELARAASLMRLSCPGVLFLCVTQVSTGALQGLGRTGAPVLNMVLASVAKVLVGVALIRIPSVNIAGAAMGTNLCFALSAVLDVAAALETGGLRWQTGSMLLRPLLAAGGMALGVAAIYNALTGASRGVAVAAAILAGVLIYGILLLVFRAIGPEDLHHLPGGGKLLIWLGQGKGRKKKC
ncbi:MAG: polysaccharide biosynthesis protein [Christensenellaceae bacterium]|nr:polysaccharide biosynthesis protein [Christensenellaceae bacterium]